MLPEIGEPLRTLDCCDFSNSEPFQLLFHFLLVLKCQYESSSKLHFRKVLRIYIAFLAFNEQLEQFLWKRICNLYWHTRRGIKNPHIFIHHLWIRVIVTPLTLKPILGKGVFEYISTLLTLIWQVVFRGWRKQSMSHNNHLNVCLMAMLWWPAKNR